MSDPVPELQELLGPVVFIDWPKGVKGSRRKWGNLTRGDMTPDYLAKLHKGNIGVALGKASDDLCAIDIDCDPMVGTFLAVNPHLEGTLSTHGSRGRVFWLRFNGDYPQRTVKLKTHAGEDVGEFRSNGSQSIIWGIHPKGRKPYTFVVRRPAMVLRYESICWPTAISNPPAVSTTTGVRECTEDTEDTEETEGTDDTEVMLDGAWLLTLRTVEDALAYSLPSKVHENNHRLFDFARGLKTVELQQGKFTPPQLRAAFSEWHSKAAKFLRPELTKEHYMIEFLNAYRQAKYPIGSIIVPKAWKAAQEQPLPPEALEFDNPKLRLLVALCRQLQILTGKEPFYLSLRVCQRLLEQDTHTTAAKWMRCLCALQILQEVEKGGTEKTPRKASRYRYLSR